MRLTLLADLNKLAGDRGGVTRADVCRLLTLTRRQVDRRLAGLAPVGTWRETRLGRPHNLYAPEEVAEAILRRMWGLR